MSLLTKEQFAAHLRRAASLIESKETFEGNVTWELTAEGHYEVGGAYRINDFGGQGAVHLFREGEDRTA